MTAPRIKSKGTINVLHLYPKEMNIYGDWGNVLTILRRLQWHGYTPQLLQYNIGDKLKADVDIIIGGGGQDSGQLVIQKDLQKQSKKLNAQADDGASMLVICGLYQLFGRYFKTADEQVIDGIGLFGAETIAGDKRMIGNIILDTELFGEVIGYENHSGQTFLDASQPSLGTVKKGDGNNSTDRTGGALKNNVIGTYLHGSLLPKNPNLADFLIEKAVERKFGEFEPSIIDDHLAQEARRIARSRPR
jgi:CobQ-like glutamine amidotransferase family enzyme